MKPVRAKPISALLAAAVLGLVIMPVTLASADGRSAIARSAVAQPHGQSTLNSLKKQITSLQRRIAALEHGAGKPQSGAAPVGPAAGSLAGSYPNPAIAAGAVGRQQIANDAVASAQIANGSVSTQDIAGGAIDQTKLATHSVGNAALIPLSVGTLELAPGAVTAERLAISFPITSQGVVVNPGQSKAATITCPEGNRILSGGFEWESPGRDGASVISSGPSFDADPNTTWAVQGRVDSGGQANTLLAEALCIHG